MMASKLTSEKEDYGFGDYLFDLTYYFTKDVIQQIEGHGNFPLKVVGTDSVDYVMTLRGKGLINHFEVGYLTQKLRERKRILAKDIEEMFQCYRKKGSLGKPDPTPVMYYLSFILTKEAIQKLAKNLSLSVKEKDDGCERAVFIQQLRKSGVITVGDISMLRKELNKIGYNKIAEQIHDIHKRRYEDDDFIVADILGCHAGAVASAGPSLANTLSPGTSIEPRTAVARTAVGTAAEVARTVLAFAAFQVAIASFPIASIMFNLYRRSRSFPDISDETETHKLLGARKVVSKEGGIIKIGATGVSLQILPNALHADVEITITILPPEAYDEQRIRFEDHCTVAVEILPDNIKLKRPATLRLPHCLVVSLKEKNTSDVMVFQSHHKKGLHTRDSTDQTAEPSLFQRIKDILHSRSSYITDRIVMGKGQNPVWEDISKSAKPKLHEKYCEISLESFCWTKYEVNGKVVKGKNLHLYTTGEQFRENEQHVTAFVGYFPALPRRSCFPFFRRQIFNPAMEGRFAGDSNTFIFLKEPPNPLLISITHLVLASDWQAVPTVRAISYQDVSSKRHGDHVPFTFQRMKAGSSFPAAHFAVSQSDESRTHLFINMEKGKLNDQSTTQGSARDIFGPVGEDIEIIFDEIATFIGREWQMVGRTLGVPEYDLICITAKHPNDLHQRVVSMLFKWKSLKGIKANGNVLVKTFEALNLQLAADNLKKALSNQII